MGGGATDTQASAGRQAGQRKRNEGSMGCARRSEPAQLPVRDWMAAAPVVTASRFACCLAAHCRLCHCHCPCRRLLLLLLMLLVPPNLKRTHHKAVLVGVVLVLVLGGQAQAGPVVSLALQAGGTHRPGHAATDAFGPCCCHRFCIMCCCSCCYCGWLICTTNIPHALLLSVAADYGSRCWHDCCAADAGAAVGSRRQLLVVIQCRACPRR